MGRSRLQDLGYHIGRMERGPLNAITDVAGVLVGHETLVADAPATVRTGITAIIPHEDPYWQTNLFAGFHRYNGFGEVTGGYWIEESGLLTTPILLGPTSAIGVLRDTMLAHPYRQDHWERFHQPFCGETNDGLLSDPLAEALNGDHVRAALDAAKPGAVAEGNVGGGTGMVCHEFKGGIGTASRVAPTKSGRYTIGALVQSNYGRRRDLRVDGVPVGVDIDYGVVPSARRREEGSIIMVVATDAPLLPVQCQRLAHRAAIGLGRVGGFGGNTSGDFALAFATGNRIPASPEETVGDLRMVPHNHMDLLFQATIEATEEAIVNSMLAAETTTGFKGRTVHALPIDGLHESMERHGRQRDPSVA